MSAFGGYGSIEISAANNYLGQRGVSWFKHMNLITDRIDHVHSHKYGTLTTRMRCHKIGIAYEII